MSLQLNSTQRLALGIATLSALLLIGLTTPAAIGAAPTRKAPDLRIREIQFDRNRPQAVRVVLGNAGQGMAGASKLRLTVRKIGGTSVGRMMTVDAPALASAGTVIIAVDAAGLLPNAVVLKDTTFRIDADSTGLVAESSEDNNLRWHKP